MKRWIRVRKCSNNEGPTYYTFPNGDRIDHLKKVKVKWPTNEKEECNVVERSYSYPIFAYGQDFQVQGTLLFVLTQHKGIIIEIPIEKLLIQILE